MNIQLYRALLILMLLVALFSIYFQFQTIGSEEYWYFVLFLLAAFVVSKLLLRHQNK